MLLKWRDTPRTLDLVADEAGVTVTQWLRLAFSPRPTGMAGLEELAREVGVPRQTAALAIHWGGLGLDDTPFDEFPFYPRLK